MKENFQRIHQKVVVPTTDNSGLRRHIAEVLYRHALETMGADNPSRGKMPTSSVLVTLQASREDSGLSMILNKRSQKVRQPGDLCFPGGGSEMPLDGILAQALQLPQSPLTRWPYWNTCRRRYPEYADEMALVLATALRESLEEMNLAPCSIRFLGPLPAQQLVMFDRQIQPMVVWTEPGQPYSPNWEVQRIITIPIRKLLEYHNYRAYHIVYTPKVAARLGMPSQVFPAFRLEDPQGMEILWGVTFRIVQTFLHLVFDFEMPPMDALPTVEGTLGREYYTGTP